MNQTIFSFSKLPYIIWSSVVVFAKNWNSKLIAKGRRTSLYHINLTQFYQMKCNVARSAEDVAMWGGTWGSEKDIISIFSCSMPIVAMPPSCCSMPLSDCSMLTSGCSKPLSDFSTLNSGYSMPPSGCSMPPSCCPMSLSNCSMLTSGCPCHLVVVLCHLVIAPC